MSRGGRTYAWWNLPRGLKDILQVERMGGKYGGQTAVGVGRAPYFWGQEYGNAAAAITGKHFAAESWGAFKTRSREHLIESVRGTLSR